MLYAKGETVQNTQSRKQKKRENGGRRKDSNVHCFCIQSVETPYLTCTDSLFFYNRFFFSFSSLFFCTIQHHSSRMMSRGEKGSNGGKKSLQSNGTEPETQSERHSALRGCRKKTKKNATRTRRKKPGSPPPTEQVDSSQLPFIYTYIYKDRKRCCWV